MKKVYLWKRVGDFLAPMNEHSEQFIKSCPYKDEVVATPKRDRSSQLNAGYFGLLSYIYDNLPEKLSSRYPRDKFYLVVKDWMGHYEVIGARKDGSEIRKYDSISFEKMDEIQFKSYIKDVVEFIVSDVLFPLKMNDFVDELLIEWEKFFDKIEN